LPKIVENLNKKPLKLLGGISPDEIKSSWDDVLIRDAQKKAAFVPFQEPRWTVQNDTQKVYKESKNKLQIGQFVYLDKKVEVFDKSFYSQVINIA